MSSHIKNVDLSLEDRLELESVTKKPSSPQGLAQRCKIILMTADKVPICEMEKKLGASRATIRKWKERYIERGFDGLFDNDRSSSLRRKYDTRIKLKISKFAKKVSREVNPKPPEGRRFWTIRTIADFLGLNRGIVQRVLQNESIDLRR
jgi:transposase